MTKKDLLLGALSGALIGLLAWPIMKNLDLPVNGNLQMALAPILFFLVPLGLAIAKFLSRYLKVLWQIAKFGVVGGLNTLVDWGILNLLMFISGIYVGVGYSVFKGISFAVAVVNSYFWNKYWTFESRQTNGEAFLKFFIVSIIGALINIAVASLIVNYILTASDISLALKGNIGAAVATFISMFWNFLGYKLIVFRK